jgi:hypothetical protein
MRDNDLLSPPAPNNRNNVAWRELPQPLKSLSPPTRISNKISYIYQKKLWLCIEL